MIVALDFDGVIMDGIDECMLVAWNVFNHNPISDFNYEKLNEIPKNFVSKFTHLRNFVRHDGHFLTSFYVHDKGNIENEKFNSIFNSIPELEKSRFREDFVNYRIEAKKQHPITWISLHKELIELKDIVDLNVDIRIVSGKDSDSIEFLLKNKGIELNPQKIHGRMLQKETVLKSIKLEAEESAQSFIFIDDNLNNVIDASKLNIPSAWALWGFNIPIQKNEAENLSINSINKENLIEYIKSLIKNEVSTMTTKNKKALLVTTSHEELGNTGRKTGFYYEELATPYWKFIDAGYQVEIASIKGGKAPADPGSLKSPAEQPDSVKRFLGDTASVRKVEASLSVSAVIPEDYSIVFLSGGHGTMWDFPQSKDLATLISKSYENGAVIGSVCHGAAGLLNAKTAGGYPLVEHKRINSFTENEEIAVGLDRVVPFILETEFKKLGAKYECAENFKPYAVTDGRLVTGQNPASSALVADAVIEAAKAIK